MPPASYPGLLANLGPRRLERRDWAGRVFGERRPEREYKPLRPALPKPTRVPGGMRYERRERRLIQRNNASSAGYGFRLAHRERLLVDQVDLRPANLAQFFVPETGVQIHMLGQRASAACAPYGLLP